MKDSGNSYGLPYPILHTSFQTYLSAAKTHSYKLFIVTLPVPFVDKLIAHHFIIATVFWVHKQGIDSHAINNYSTQHHQTINLNLD
jgi:hypothetical protein